MTAQVMGFLAQCQICPQQAVLTEQDQAWVCPACSRLAPFTAAQARNESTTVEPCASGHPAIRDHLCGLPFGHAGDHSTHVMHWPNLAEREREEDLDLLRKVQG